MENLIKKYGYNKGIKKYENSKIKRRNSMNKRIERGDIKYDKSASRINVYIFPINWLVTI